MAHVWKSHVAHANATWNRISTSTRTHIHTHTHTNTHIRVTWHLHVRGMTSSCVYLDYFYLFPVSTRVMQLLFWYCWKGACKSVTSSVMCDVTSSLCMLWLLHVCSCMCVASDLSLSFVWQVSFVCVTWLLHMCDTTLSHVWLDSFISVAVRCSVLQCACVAHLFHMCDSAVGVDVTHSYVWQINKDVMFASSTLDTCDMSASNCEMAPS